MKTNLFTFSLLKITALSILLSTAPSFSLAKGKGSDGGADKKIFDLTLEDVLDDDKRELLDQRLSESISQSATVLTHYVQSGAVKNDMVKLVQDQEFLQTIKSQSAKNLLKEMVANGLAVDILKTPYVVQEHCFDEARIPKFLSTRIGSRQSPICVSPRKFYEDYYENKDLYKIVGTSPDISVRWGNHYKLIPEWQIIAMFLHDHARQFGVIVDDDHRFASAIAIALFKYPRLFRHFHSADSASGVSVSDAKSNVIWNTVRVAGIWKIEDLEITVTIPEESRCGKIPDQDREVVGKRSSSLMYTFQLSGKHTYYYSFKLNCRNSSRYSDEFGIESAHVSIKMKSTGREILSFEAKGREQRDSGAVSISPSSYRITGEHFILAEDYIKKSKGE